MRMIEIEPGIRCGWIHDARDLGGLVFFLFGFVLISFRWLS